MSDQMQLFPLTDEEWRERSKRLAAKEIEYDRVEAEKKTYDRDANKELKRLRTELKTLAEAVTQGKEWRDLLGGHDDDAPYRDR